MSSPQATAQTPKLVNRGSERVAAARAVNFGSPPARVQCAGSMKVSSPQDPAEKEAERTAARVVRMPAPAATAEIRPGATGAARRPAVARQTPPFTQRASLLPSIARKGEGAPDVGANVAAEISSSEASGAPLPPSVRRFMEPRFGASFERVRVHTDARAARLNRQLAARAFTVGNQIFFGHGQFQPDSQDGRELIAHELTHTVQQGAATQAPPLPQAGGAAQRKADEGEAHHHEQRQEEAPVRERGGRQVHRLGISDALDYFADHANNIPGFRMFTIVLGVNPINMSSVERSPANIMRAIVEFLPGGAQITQALDNHGVFDRVGNWVSQQIDSLGMTGHMIRDAIDQFLDSLSWRDIFHLGDVWDRAKRIFSAPIDRIVAFVRNLVTGILRFIREAILRPLAALAEGTRGYDLLKAVLGEDPVTGDPVPRTPEALIGGFMRLIGEEEIWTNIQNAHAIPRAWAWFQGALAGLMGFVRQIPGLFIQAFQQLEIADLILVPRAFARIASVFGGFIGQFLSWAGRTIWDLLEIIFAVVAPGVMVYLRRAAGAFRTILRNPIGFVRNLVRAGVQGLRQFAANFLTHLRASIIGWLTGAMGAAGVYIPTAFTFVEILKFVLSVLGLTWQNIRTKLVRAIGETAVAALETTFDIVRTLVTQGPAAAWERIQEALANLRDMVMEQVMNFVATNIVQAAITRLVTSLNPAGAFIQAIIAIYNTIMFFVERLRQIAQVAAAVIDSIAAIASGVIAAAANRVEQTLAGLLTLAISFLARIVGLGRVSDAVTNIINRIRAPIDRALDRVVDWIVTQARRLGRLIAGAASRVVSWWRNRRSFAGADGHNHSLYFTGEGRAARVTLASNPMPVEAFLASIQNRAEYQAPAKRALIAQVRQQVTAIQTAQALPEAQSTQAEQQINAAFATMGPLLAQLVGGGDFATEAQPLPLAYPKRRWSAYPVIYIGPRSDNRVTQASLASRNIAAINNQLSAAERSAWAAQGTPIVACRPGATTTLPTGASVGIAADYHVEPGKKIRLVPQSTAGGGLINRTFAPFGFRARSEGMDGDHVLEMQLGGPNILPNLWPLQAGENRSSGSVISRLNFTKPDGTQIGMDALKTRARSGTDVWFVVVSTL